MAGDSRWSSVYFGYRVGRHLKSYLGSGSVGTSEALSEAVRGVVLLALEAFIRRGAKDRGADGVVDARVDLAHTASAGLVPTGMRSRLGASRGAELGEGLVLGGSPAAVTPVASIRIAVSLADLHALKACPASVEAILDAIDAAVPLCVDYRVRFAVAKRDQTFRLGAREGAEARIGLTAELGAD